MRSKTHDVMQWEFCQNASTMAENEWLYWFVTCCLQTHPYTFSWQQTHRQKLCYTHTVCIHTENKWGFTVHHFYTGDCLRWCPSLCSAAHCAVNWCFARSQVTAAVTHYIACQDLASVPTQNNSTLCILNKSWSSVCLTGWASTYDPDSAAFTAALCLSGASSSISLPMQMLHFPQSCPIPNPRPLCSIILPPFCHPFIQKCSKSSLSFIFPNISSHSLSLLTLYLSGCASLFLNPLGCLAAVLLVALLNPS